MSTIFTLQLPPEPFIDDAITYTTMEELNRRRARLEAELTDILLTALTESLGSRSLASVALNTMIDVLTCKTIVEIK